MSETQSIRPSLFTVPVNRAFADALVEGVMARHGADRLGLAAGMILLPNNRAVTAVRDAFIRHAGGALLLPRLVVLGDDDLDDGVGAALDRIDVEEEPLPPAIAPMRRRFLLAQLIVAERDGTPAGEAIRLADSLARVFDVLTIEEVALDRLAALDDTAMASHWQEAFALLQRLCRRWPEILAAQGAMDRAARRNAIYDRIARRWRARGLPAPFVVAAGVTSTAPAIARLLRTIAFAPGGTVLLPHLDVGMPADWWDALGDDPAALEDGGQPPLDGHPHFHLKLLLERMGMASGEVQPWPHACDADGPATRPALVRQLFAPAQFTAAWQHVRRSERDATGISLVECATPAEEALAIALAMREVLNVPGRTAALVTPDRAIATRVAGHLARWGVAADDSAGQPLTTTAAGELLLSLAGAASSGFAPVQLISLLSHPFVATDDRMPWLDRVRGLDLLLRGPRPAAGLACIDALLRESARKADGSIDGAGAALRDWWSQSVMPLLLPVEGRFATDASVDLATMVGTLRQALTTLSAETIWTGTAGRALARLFETIEADANVLTTAVRPQEVVPLLAQLMRDVAVRPPQGGHPRLFIWGLIEGRLQRADRMILAGLNEGQWPQPPSPDPWLAPVMRKKLGLPGLDRPAGLAAHDFASALGAAEVIITRSQRQGSAPTVASRLVLRLEALVGDRALMAGQAGLASLAAAIDACATPQPIARPAPAPPRARRPTQISITEVDRLLADPFAFYARNALGLFRLDPLDAEPTPAWRGTMVHAVLERWLKQGDGSIDRLEPIVEDLLDGPGVSPVLRTLWAPRLRPALRWAVGEIVRMQREERRMPILSASEQRGEIRIDGIRLSGRPDRIDRLADGSLAIVDYKTGSGPAKRSVEALFALQLGLIGLMAQQGAFAGEQGPVSTYEYWRTNRRPKGEGFGWVDTPFLKQEATVDAGNFAERAEQRLREGISRWLNGDEPFKAKLAPEHAPYADYDQLMRLEEWYGRERAQ
jgi:ATP-dependent helicase/nuclease subunit B